ALINVGVTNKDQRVTLVIYDNIQTFQACDRRGSSYYLGGAAAFGWGTGLSENLADYATQICRTGIFKVIDIDLATTTGGVRNIQLVDNIFSRPLPCALGRHHDHCVKLIY